MSPVHRSLALLGSHSGRGIANQLAPSVMWPPAVCFHSWAFLCLEYPSVVCLSLSDAIQPLAALPGLARHPSPPLRVTNCQTPAVFSAAGDTTTHPQRCTLGAARAARGTAQPFTRISTGRFGLSAWVIYVPGIAAGRGAGGWLKREFHAAGSLTIRVFLTLAQANVNAISRMGDLLHRRAKPAAWGVSKLASAGGLSPVQQWGESSQLLLLRSYCYLELPVGS